MARKWVENRDPCGMPVMSARLIARHPRMSVCWLPALPNCLSVGPEKRCNSRASKSYQIEPMPRSASTTVLPATMRPSGPKTYGLRVISVSSFSLGRLRRFSPLKCRWQLSRGCTRARSKRRQGCCCDPLASISRQVLLPVGLSAKQIAFAKPSPCQAAPL